METSLQQTLQHLLVSNDGRVSRLEVLEGPTGRRKWPDEIKARIVAETLAPGARVSAVARRHGVSAQYLTTWRRLARTGRLVLPACEQSFASVIVEAEQARQEAAAPGWIEVESGGVIVRLPANASSTLIGEIAARLRAPVSRSLGDDR
jgi:transposase